MEPMLKVDFDLIVETRRSPFRLEEWDGYGLSELIELKTTSSNGVHNRGVMDGLDCYASLLGSTH